MKLFALLFLLLHGILSAQNFNRPVSPHLYPYEFQLYDTGNYGKYMLTPYWLLGGPADPGYVPPSALILDDDGYVLWYRTGPRKVATNFRYHPASDLFTWCDVVQPGNVQYRIMDSFLDDLDSIVPLNGNYPDSHEFMVKSDGHFVISTKILDTMDLSAWNFQGSPGDTATVVYCFGIQEFDTSLNLVWQWNSCNHLHPSLGYGFYGYAQNGFDYCHGNSISEDLDGDYIVSFRHMNSVCKISRATGNVIWSLGGKNNSFVFVNDSGFTAQHDASFISSGRLTVFDNANMMSPPKVSRAVEYQIDTINWTATKVWEYAHNPGFHVKAMGNFQTFNSNKLIGNGWCSRPDASFTFLDSQDNLISQAFFQDGVISYRAMLFQPFTPIPRPLISCMEAGDSVILTGPAQGPWLWSTGDSTQSITVFPDQDFQFYAPYGSGYAASLPFVPGVTPCNLNSIAPTKDENTEIATQVFDLFGRKAEVLIPGVMYFEVKADGRVRKWMAME